MKPVESARKQKGPAQTPNSEADTSAPSLFQQGMFAARDLWMGPINGEPGKIGELENETWACERSTAEAIRGAEPTRKLSALSHGVDELQERLCASGKRYYNECFELALRNRAELDATLSVVAGELGRTPPVSNPAEFARVWTIGDLSAFLRVSALDGKEKAQEIGSDGRVREFIRHVCGDYSDVLVDPDAEQNKVFLLPRWPTGRGIAARLAQWWLPPANGDESSSLTREETEEFILGTEEILIKKLRRAIAHAHRLALVKQASVIETKSQVLASLSEGAQYTRVPKWKSDLRKAIFACWQQNPDLKDTDKGTLEWLRRHKPTVIRANWEQDVSSAGKTFTKMRKLLKDHETLSTAITRR
jgi:hypothetical protein